MAEIKWFCDGDLEKKVLAEYGMPEDYYNGFAKWPREKKEEVQNLRLIEQVKRAAEVPMFKRIWAERGFDPSTFRGLEDLHKIPVYTIEDIRESIERCPPLGDYQGADLYGDEPARIYFSGGTTGVPRPTVYTAWDRVAASLLSTRQFYKHGLRPGDVVINSFAYGTHNGAFIVDEALWYWMNCRVITASTGNVTSSKKQLQMALDYKAVTIFTTSDYLLKLRDTADEMGLKPSDFNFKFFSTIGDIKAVERAWGVPTFEYYAFHEVQSVAASCENREGMHIFEDCFIVEILDPETGEPLPDGETGDLVVTCLYKTGSPQIRFNAKDLSSIIPGPCSCGSTEKRMTPLAGRSDCMVKLRGINVWPEAIGDALKAINGAHMEYFCLCYKNASGDTMRTFVETTTENCNPEYEDFLSKELQAKSGVKIEIQAVLPGQLDELTGAGKTTKLKRFRDERKNEALSGDILRIYRK